MSKLVNYGRWSVALFFALQGLATLFAAIADAVSTIRSGSGSLYPTYEQLIESGAFVVCSWGLVKMHNWAYWLATGICILEVMVIALLVLSSFKTIFGTWFVSDGIFLGSGSILIPALIACASLVWLLLPPVRAQYLQREFSA